MSLSLLGVGKGFRLYALLQAHLFYKRILCILRNIFHFLLSHSRLLDLTRISIFPLFTPLSSQSNYISGTRHVVALGYSLNAHAYSRESFPSCIVDRELLRALSLPIRSLSQEFFLRYCVRLGLAFDSPREKGQYCPLSLGVHYLTNCVLLFL